ncbi:STAS domain-containing protein [Actinoplanes regularis]|uniref:Anti-anti-sigma factor n=1 Tax=Actinoplanes regularis TaxID=52697 RepID=A0A239J9K4_9ACTN|nr:STAS domain-containing protein [Actinoplanes regularis]GIE91647.1 hypothetical protein Are01nite_81270 [Actinoplanes regularis]SNT02520.1 anti-anti-sigma factor [Actinoplanes regularis]
MTEQIWTHTVDRNADECTVVLGGELDLSIRDALLDVFTAQLEQPGTSVVRVDLAAVTFLDSTILSVFVNAYQKAQGLARRFTVINPRGLPQRSLEATGLLRLLSP